MVQRRIKRVVLAFSVYAAAFTLGSAAVAAAAATIDIDVNRPGPAIPASFYGLMTEEINHSYAGGLFAELVQNRTFQDDARRPAHWSLAAGSAAGATMRLDGDNPVNGALPVSLRIDLPGGRAGVANDGYWGVPVRPDTRYKATFFAKGTDGFAGPINAQLVLDDGDRIVAHSDSKPVTGAWQQMTVELTTGHDAPTTAKAKFVLSAEGTGRVWLSMVSLFPPTYGDVPGGLRPDLMKLMADLHPAFIRLPGGNYVEGDTFATRYDWKRQIGPAELRPGHQGCWFYRSDDGFGLPQCLLWCKQLHVEPILALFAGYTLNHDFVPAGPDLQRFVDEGLEEIEYVTGPADSPWGSRRAADGFKEPFHLTYVEIGNEDSFDPSGSYDGRYTQFFKAIRAKYPQLQLIATAPVKSVKSDLYDDHYYNSPRQMAFDWEHYHHPTGPSGYIGGHTTGPLPAGTKVFVGEWASQEGRPTPDLNAALGDAVWLMGLERDADVVPIQCYAPLLANVNPGAWQWPTNLIGYDALHSFGSPSYYAQVLFGQNKGDMVLPAVLSGVEPPANKQRAPHGAVGIGTWHTDAEFKDIVVTDPDGKTLVQPDLMRDAAGWRFTGGRWRIQGGTAKPSAADAETWAVTGDANWTDYALQLKARKTSGSEGFLILYHVADGEHFGWWNIGGWGNTAAQFELTDGGARQAFGPRADTQIEVDRWYDLRLEVRGRHIRGFINGQLVSDATEPEVKPRAAVFASASYATASAEVILKAVNMDDESVDTTINLRGVATVSPTAKAWVLAGGLQDVNTIDEPTRIILKAETVNDVSASFQRTFPAHSLTLIRLAAKAK